MKYEIDRLDETVVTLDTYNSDLNLVIDASKYSAHPLTQEGFAFMWSGARASHGADKGKFCFEVKIVEHLEVSHLPADEPNPHVVRVGFSVDSTSMQLGEEPLSYGYGGTGKISSNCQFKNFGPPFTAGDSILAAVNADTDPVQIGFAKNGNFAGWAYKVNKSELKGKALFPHVLTKNCSFEVNFGQKGEPYFKLPEAVKDFTFIGCLPLDKRVAGTRAPEKREDCEMIMMCGLPGAGKSVWATDYALKNLEKKFTILGTNNIIEKMKVMGLPRKRNYHGRWDVLIQMATKCLNTMFSIGSKLRRNYVLDQTNVYPTAQRRKMRNFDGFKRIAVVVVPSEAEYKKRCDKRDRDEGKEIPDSAVLEMKANFKIPEENDIFDEIIFTELQREESEKLVSQYNEEGKAATGPAKKHFRSNEPSGFGERKGNFGSFNKREDNQGGYGGGYGRDNFEPHGGFDSGRDFYGRGDDFGGGYGSPGGRGGFDNGRGGRGGYDGGRGGRGGFDGSRGGRGGYDGGRGGRGGFDSGRGGFDGGRGGFDSGRGGFDSDRGGRGGFDNGRSGRGGFDSGRGGRGGFDSSRGGRGGFDSNRGSRDSYDSDRGGYDSGRGGRGSYGNDRGGRGGYDSDRAGRGGYDSGRGGRGGFDSSRGGYDSGRGGRGGYDDGRGERGGYDSSRGGGGRGGYDSGRGGRGGYDSGRGGRGGYDSGRGGRGGFDSSRGGRGGFDNNRGGRDSYDSSYTGGYGSQSGDSSRRDSYDSYGNSGKDTPAGGYGRSDSYGSYNKSSTNYDQPSDSAYGSSSTGYSSATSKSGYDSPSYNYGGDMSYGSSTTSNYSRGGTTTNTYQRSGQDNSQAASQSSYGTGSSYTAKEPQTDYYSGGYGGYDSTGAAGGYSSYGATADNYSTGATSSTYAGAQAVKSEPTERYGAFSTDMSSKPAYGTATGYSARTKTRWGAENPTPAATPPAATYSTGAVSSSYDYPKTDPTPATLQSAQTYDYGQAMAAPAAQPWTGAQGAASVNQASYTTGQAAAWPQYGQQPAAYQYYTQ